MMEVVHLSYTGLNFQCHDVTNVPVIQSEL